MTKRVSKEMFVGQVVMYDGFLHLKTLSRNYYIPADSSEMMGVTVGMLATFQVDGHYAYNIGTTEVMPFTEENVNLIYDENKHQYE